jgi:GxxExxY protein
MTVITTAHEEELATAIVHSAFEVHKFLGPGLLESVYEACFLHELESRAIPCRRQVRVPLVYRGFTLTDHLKLDILVDDLVICELKSVDSLNSLFLAQIMSQLRLTGKQLGFLINFNVAKIKDGIRRVVMSHEL